MDIGYFGLNQGPFCDPENMAALVKTLEQAGYESVWTGEHVVLMDAAAYKNRESAHINNCIVYNFY